MREINMDRFGPAATELITRALAEGRPKILPFGPSATEVLPSLKAMTDQTLSQNRRVRMPHDAEALHAGLWLLFDFQTESHDISQKIATPSGSFWHGILHRREPDASNAKYWFMRVGEHPVFPELLADARETASASPGLSDIFLKALDEMNAWDAAWFVDQCVTAVDPHTVKTLITIQRREWLLLFEYNFQKAFVG